MKLKVVATGSKGNCYILESSTNERLVIELGVKFSEVLKAIDFQLDSVVGCLCSHGHADHSKGVADAVKAGLDVYSIIENCNKKITHQQTLKIGSFTVMPLDARHDVPCVAFVIHHFESGVILFATDTIYLKYRVPNLSQIIIEANYCEDILDEKELFGKGNEYVSNRVRRSHMSVQQCERTIKQQDLRNVRNIVLIHLSDGNSHEVKFQAKIAESTGKRVTVARAGVELDFNKTDF
jgi:phosphoribosyl 1,2-cyclic phosphodiesterase